MVAMKGTSSETQDASIPLQKPGSRKTGLPASLGNCRIKLTLCRSINRSAPGFVVRDCGPVRIRALSRNADSGALAAPLNQI
jgi:hypothetical protein